MATTHTRPASSASIRSPRRARESALARGMGSEDALVPSRFGRALYEHATAAKQFELIEGGTHTTTTWRGTEQYRAALREFFGVGTAASG